MGFRGADAAVMHLHRIRVCLLMLVCVRCEASDADAGQDRAGRLRLAWLLSMKESALEDKGASHVHLFKKAGTYQLLYCPVGIGFHLEILTNGTVRGVHQSTEHSQVRMFAMKPGVVGVQGMTSGLYLCMNKEGRARGMGRFSPDCLFKEDLEENHYSTYSSAAYPGLYLALSSRGQLRRGDTAGRTTSAPTSYLGTSRDPSNEAMRSNHAGLIREWNADFKGPLVLFF